jgi:hypothetical protein
MVNATQAERQPDGAIREFVKFNIILKSSSFRLRLWNSAERAVWIGCDAVKQGFTLLSQTAFCLKT